MAENANRAPPRHVSIFIDKGSSSEEHIPPKRSATPIPQKNILAYDDDLLDIDNDDSDGIYSGNCSCDEDTQSRSSSTDLNNFLQIKQVNLGEKVRDINDGAN